MTNKVIQCREIIQNTQDVENCYIIWPPDLRIHQKNVHSIAMFSIF